MVVESRSNGGVLATPLSLKAAVGLPHPLAAHHNDPTLWIENRPTWRITDSGNFFMYHHSITYRCTYLLTGRYSTEYKSRMTVLKLPPISTANMICLQSRDQCYKTNKLYSNADG